MVKRKLSEKSITGSLLRIAMLVLITVGSLFVLGLIYRVIIGDFPPDRDNSRLVFTNANQLHGYGNSNQPVVKKPTLLEFLKDDYMDRKYRAKHSNAKDNQNKHYHKTQFTEKIIITNHTLLNWDTKIADFCKNTGFEGTINNEDPKISTTWKVRNFESMVGTFNLAEPRDTVIFRRNADFLVKNILAIFDGERTKFNLSKQPISIINPNWLSLDPVGTGHNHKVNIYQVFYEQLLEEKIPNLSEHEFKRGLLIGYDIEEKNYDIFNLLFTIPLSSQKDLIGRQAALTIARKTVQQRKNLPSSVIDTLSADIWKEYKVRYPEMKSPYYYYIQSVWHIYFPWALYSDSDVSIDFNYGDGYKVDAYNGKVYGEYGNLP